MSSSFEEIYDALRSDAALFEEAQAQPEQAEEVMVKEAPVQQSTVCSRKGGKACIKEAILAQASPSSYGGGKGHYGSSSLCP